METKTKPDGFCMDCGGEVPRGYYRHTTCGQRYRLTEDYRSATLARYPEGHCVRCTRLGNWWAQARAARAGQRRRIDVDHVRPIARGGTHDPSNLVPLCAKPHHDRKTKRDLAAMAWERASLLDKAQRVLSGVGRSGRRVTQATWTVRLLVLVVAWVLGSSLVSRVRAVDWGAAASADQAREVLADLAPWAAALAALVLVTAGVVLHLRRVVKRLEAALSAACGGRVRVSVRAWRLAGRGLQPRVLRVRYPHGYTDDADGQARVEDVVKRKTGWESLVSRWDTTHDTGLLSTPNPFVVNASARWPGMHDPAEPIPLGVDVKNARVDLDLTERNLLIGGEPGGGKSNVLSILLAAFAADPEIDLYLVDGKVTEQKIWEGCAEDLVTTPEGFRDLLVNLQEIMQGRYELMAMGTDVDKGVVKRKIEKGDGQSLIVLAIDELRLFTTASTPAAKKIRDENVDRLIDIVSRGRAAGIITIAATQRPSADVIPTALRDLFGYRLAMRCSTPSSSDMVLGMGWAAQGASASKIDPAARGAGYLLADGGTPRLVRAYYVDDADLLDLAGSALAARRARVDRLLRAEPAEALAGDDQQA